MKAAAESRRDEIVAVSAALFRSHGYRDASVRDIAKALDIKSASLYYHFESKDDILVAIALGLMEDFVAEVTPVLAEHPDDPVAAIKAVVDVHLRFDFANLDRVIVSARERRSLPEELQRPINVLRARHRRAVQRVVEAGEAQGTFVLAASPRTVTSALLDLITGVKEWYHPPRDGRLETLIAHYQSFVLALLGR